MFFAPSDDGTVPRVVTDLGIRIGSTLAEVEAAYGRDLPRDIFHPEGDPYAGLVVGVLGVRLVVRQSNDQGRM